MAAKRHKLFVPQSVGERVAHARRLLGVREGADILAPDLADRIGVTTNAVYAWEAGTVPGRKNLERLAAELGVTPEWIHYGVGEKPLTTFHIPDAMAETFSQARRDAADAAPAEEPDPPKKKAVGGRRAAKHPKDRQ